MIFELHPMQDKRKSFYRKAFVEVSDDNELMPLREWILHSYDSKVIMIQETNDYNGKFYEIYLNAEVDDKLIFSMTTLRHMKEFLVQYTGHDFTSKEIKKLPRIKF